jgi:hypothetical protein
MLGRFLVPVTIIKRLVVNFGITREHFSRLLFTFVCAVRRFVVQFESTDTCGVGDVLIDNGRWQSTYGESTNKGTYRQIWKKCVEHSGNYFIYHDEWKQDN